MPKPASKHLETVRRLILAFPGVEEGPSYGTPGFRVRKKPLADLRDVFEEAWRRNAPKRLVAQYDEAHKP